MNNSWRTAFQQLFKKPLPSAGTLEVPDSRLLRRSGFDAQTLRLRGVLPQRSSIAPAGFALVVDRPEAVSVREFEQAGVQILRATAPEIERIWELWSHEQAENEDILGISRDVTRVLHQIVSDCSELGAQEVFLGHPSDCSYEGIARNKRFSGFVHQRVFVECLSAVRRMGEFTLSSSPPCRAALTRNFERPIVCLTWTTPRKVEAVVPPPKPPMSFPSSAPAVVPAPNREMSPDIRRRLLLVDDDERFGHVLAQILETRGYHLTRAKNGEQALAVLDSFPPPDLVVSDIHMPVVDGRSLVLSLRERRSDIPVLMLTSDDNQILEADLVMLGANAYIRKSEDPRVLLAWIQNLLHRRDSA